MKGAPEVLHAADSLVSSPMHGKMPYDGYVLLDKTPGSTSFDALHILKRAFGTKKIGHTGTLDKFAQGLMVILIGRATRLAQWFSEGDKTYVADFFFGTQTDTLDPEGYIVASAPPPTKEEIEKALPLFLGPILQAPPLFSAIHIEGRRAHELARSGVELEMKPRPVTIHSLELLFYDGERGRFRISCSKGTYIRSLARDIALAAGSRAHVVALTRTRVHNFDISDAVDPTGQPDPSQSIRDALKPIDSKVFQALGIPCLSIEDSMADSIRNGRRIGEWILDDIQGIESKVGLFDAEGRFIALLEKKIGGWTYGIVYDRH